MSDLRDLRYLNYISSVRRLESYSRPSSPVRQSSPPRYESFKSSGLYSSSYSSKPRHTRTQSGYSYSGYKSNASSFYNSFESDDNEPIYLSSYSKPRPTYAEVEKDILEKSLRRSRLICADLIKENQQLKSNGGDGSNNNSNNAGINLVNVNKNIDGLYSLLQNVQSQNPQSGLHVSQEGGVQYGKVYNPTNVENAEQYEEARKQNADGNNNVPVYIFPNAEAIGDDKPEKAEGHVALIKSGEGNEVSYTQAPEEKFSKPEPPQQEEQKPEEEQKEEASGPAEIKETDEGSPEKKEEGEQQQQEEEQVKTPENEKKQDSDDASGEKQPEEQQESKGLDLIKKSLKQELESTIEDINKDKDQPNNNEESANKNEGEAAEQAANE